MTPIATPYQDANGTNTRLESQIELDEELHLSPVKFYYSHNDPGQYSIGNTPDLQEESYTPIQRVSSSSLRDEDSKLSAQEGMGDAIKNLSDVEEEEEDKLTDAIDKNNPE